MRAIAMSRATIVSSASAGRPASPSEYEWTPSCMCPSWTKEGSSQ